jgi:Nucleotide modification associated domain 2
MRVVPQALIRRSQRLRSATLIFRKFANKRELVIAFAGKPLGHKPDTVMWAGIVREKLLLADYWRDPRFERKKPRWSRTPDNIYKPTARGLRQVRNPVHNLDHDPRDQRGEYALVFDPAWRLEPTVSSLPDQFARLRLGPLHRRRYRTTEIDKHTAAELLAWLSSHKARRSKRIETNRPHAKPATCGSRKRRLTKRYGC